MLEILKGLLPLIIYFSVYVMVSLFPDKTSGGTTMFGLDTQTIVAIAGAVVSEATILGNIIKDRKAEEGEHKNLTEQIKGKHELLAEQIRDKHELLTGQINEKYSFLEKQISDEHKTISEDIKDIRDYTLAFKAAKEAASKSKVDISNVFAQIERLASDAEKERQNMQSLRESWRKEKERNEKLEKEIIQLEKKNKKLMKQLEEYKELQVKQQQQEYPER